VIVNILTVLNTMTSLRRAKLKAIDFIDGITESVDPVAKTFSCRGIARLSNGRLLSGAFAIRNSQSGPVWAWSGDQFEATAKPSTATQQVVPPTQLDFLDTIVGARTSYLDAKTDFQKGVLRPARAKSICASLKSMQVKDWGGEVVKLTTTSDGWGVIAVQIGPDIVLQTAFADFSDMGRGTLIKPGNKLFEVLGRLDKGDLVRFSGEFFPAEADCVDERSVTMRGAMTEPAFIFKFSSIEPF